MPVGFLQPQSFVLHPRRNRILRLRSVAKIANDEKGQILRFGRPRANGGGGDNDVLSGGAGKDIINGSKGRDVAIGGPDRDNCRAEVEKSCER